MGLIEKKMQKCALGIMENKMICPDCGTPLEFSYEREDGTKVYRCPLGDENYIFVEENGYLYAVCLFNGRKTCMGLA